MLHYNVNIWYNHIKKYAKSTYVNGIIISIITMIVFTGEYVTANAIILTLLTIAIYLLLYKLKNRKNRNRKSDKQISKQLSIGFYLGVSNILTVILALFLIILFYKRRITWNFIVKRGIQVLI